MLKGIDVSRHNRNMKEIDTINDFDFVIMKSSEGATYRDSSIMYYDHVLHRDALKGFYHFARPENGNSPKSEASNFIGAIRLYDSDRAVLALDIEDKALSVANLDEWALDWCKYVESATGVKPLIYCSQSEVWRFKKCCEFGCGLWVAKWGLMKPAKKNIKPWDFFAFWQQSNNHIVSGVRCDIDYFNGNRAQYLKYCKEGLSNE